VNQADTQPNERGTALGLSLIFTLVGLQVAALLGGVSTERPVGVMLMGILLLELGAIVLASYFYSHKSFFFRWLMSLIERFPLPSSRKWAFFWVILFLVGGVLTLHRGLAIL
jgi:hypothetical protein